MGGPPHPVRKAEGAREPEPVHGVEAELKRFSGARAVRIADPSGTSVEEHSHAWPILSLYIMGGHRKRHELGETWLNGPSAVLHAAGAAHANDVGERGLEQLDIEFDPAWLRGLNSSPAFQNVRCWVGGPVAAAARRLAASWIRGEAGEAQLSRSTASFLDFALRAPLRTPPAWVEGVLSMRTDCVLSTQDRARALGISPAWLAQAYRSATGEGIAETMVRRRVEEAALLLETSRSSHADIAAASGFCDQSHMIRSFRRILGRTPSQVARERLRI